MITTKELNHIREAGRQLVAVRNAVAEQSERLEQQTAYRKQVLVCGGTGCTSSGSKKVIAALEEALRGGEAGEGRPGRQDGLLRPVRPGPHSDCLS